MNNTTNLESRKTLGTTSKGLLKQLLAKRESGVFIALLLMCVFLSLSTSAFLSVRNLLNIGRQVSLIGIMAVGMTFVLIAREIDLSIGSVYALAGIVTSMLLTSEVNVWVSIAGGLSVGAILGLLSGWLSTYGRLPSFITTLGMMSAVRGAALLITEGQPVTVSEAAGAPALSVARFTYLGQGRLFDTVPMQLIFLVVVTLIGGVLLSKTVLGFKIYAVGGSEKAARVSGIRVFNIKMITFAVMGFLSALAGILCVAFLPSTQAGRTGVGIEMDVIAAAIVGGASLTGGEGTILGTLLGVLIIGVLRNGLVLLGISAFWQETAIGLVIILAVGLDMWTRSGRQSAS
ncbi:MAG: ABC transporter permease [Anaerolineales bacterium]|nr:ABC transporter permease [Anaerolineales bacterium]